MTIEKDLPPDRADWTFGDLVYWHFFRYGTRPTGNPERPQGRKWNRGKVCSELKISDRTLRNWIGDKTRPRKEFPVLLEELFGANAAYDSWRKELIAAHAERRNSLPMSVWRKLSRVMRSEHQRLHLVGGLRAIFPGAISGLGQEARANAMVPGSAVDADVVAKGSSSEEHGAPAVRGGNEGLSTRELSPSTAEIDVSRPRSGGEERTSKIGGKNTNPFQEPIDAEFEEILLQVHPQPPGSAPSTSVRRVLVGTLLTTIALLLWMSVHSNVEKPSAPGTMIGSRHVHADTSASETETASGHMRQTQESPEPHSSPPASATTWREAQDKEALRRARQTPEEAAAEKIAAWDKQVQAVMNAGFSIQASSTLEGGDKLGRAPAQTPEACARSCTGANCKGFTFEEQRGLCDLYTGPVQFRQYGLGYTAGIRSSRTSAEDVLVPTTNRSALPITKVQATSTNPDDVTRCATGSYKVPGFDLVCDRKLGGGTTLGSHRLYFKVQDMNECASTCDSVTRCVGFSFEANGRPPMCWLYGPGTLQINKSGGSVSGLRCAGVTDKQRLQQTGPLACPAG
ncbi:MAG TPA: PAN domain-containing protein [Stellaceae bacterium]|nr:PAN domain-containing protein [Stellaceae bacterium]